ncbi:hypothetical protein K469DRAFT_721577 [Zopfia rhizophila CBS 207.26]|uniref:Nucleoside 2-deoxyribosyltransferase n=1 Tax=Zopfia rhizophila CBS 207.26 TaxID=1314779 RepID=A0A6A6EIY3_9PEZI|nr:hypothetical protein K469DRAFT_721577 [Zopfia rhizophila CBS 207.26]
MSPESSPEFVIHKPPFRHTVDKPSVILYGSIEKNTSVNWQTELGSSLSHLPVAILNPHRDDWDSTWIEDISFPKFKEQVEWEMDYAKVADVIVLYFAPGTLAPVSLLELGMYAGTGKVIACCPPGFHKRGNVQIVAQRYGIPLVEGLNELKEQVRRRLEEKLEARDKS